MDREEGKEVVEAEGSERERREGKRQRERGRNAPGKIPPISA